MKKSGILFIILCLIFLVQLVAVPAFAVPESVLSDNSAIHGSHSLDAQYPVLGKNRLVSNTQSVILYEVNSDTLLYAWNADQQQSPASFVKILTALIAIEQGDLDSIVAAKEAVLKTIPYDAMSAGLKPEEELSLKDLIYLMLVGSANDAAAVIADHISGSQDAFVMEMNRYAEELGCTNTKFTNAHGLSDKEQYTTARDIARILAAAVKLETFRQAFGATKYTVEATNKSGQRNLVTGNFLMSKASLEIYYDTRVTGGRTGVTEDDLRCLASTASYNGMNVISIVMGCKTEYEKDGFTVKKYGSFPETSKLLDQCFDGYKTSQLLFEGQVLRRHPVAGATNSLFLGTEQAAATVLPSGVTIDDLDFRYSDLNMQFQAPIEKGQALATVEIWYGNTCLAQTRLVSMNEVRTPQTDSYTEPNAPEEAPVWPTVLAVTAVVVILLLVLLLVIRTRRNIRSAAARRRSRNYCRSRRRSR